jgi:hypothetical protein
VSEQIEGDHGVPIDERGKGCVPGCRAAGDTVNEDDDWALGPEWSTTDSADDAMPVESDDTLFQLSHVVGESSEWLDLEDPIDGH